MMKAHVIIILFIGMPNLWVSSGLTGISLSTAGAQGEPLLKD